MDRFSLFRPTAMMSSFLAPRASRAVFGKEVLVVCMAALYVTTEGPGLLLTNILGQPERHN